ncbi:Crp/Fnr family transcriptional regulator [Variovorax sp. YR216]|uniref:Crp/Fnr family transcriptional regulator n=1 Tax=Variovorax sp. YR216 TaxID=1882828 RepID=UPI00089BD8AB|nr:Crp/Fnr family transcriptional regulator [Variovorax sp. YR216]SEA54571.1 CRP/FNR family transcriptional regulator, anaerobic regulatory protein [Variovorax sp. YR216]
MTIESGRRAVEEISFGQRIADTLHLVQATLPVQRRMVHAGDAIYQVGQDFGSLYVVNSGLVKMVNLSSEGREQVVALHFRGDWLGLDGIASGHYGCDAIAMDTGEVWSFRYEDLLNAALRTPALLSALHQAMSRQLARDHESLQSLCALPADARVAGFLHYWAEAMEKRGLRTDQISLRMTRAEIGNYLGMTLETVSRALSRMARGDVIRFLEKGRREIHIPRVDALTTFMRQVTTPVDARAFH